MAQDTTRNGKAFEYACIESLRTAFAPSQKVHVMDSNQLRTARKCYWSIESGKRADMRLAAEAMGRVIVRLEPKLENFKPGDVLTLALQSDERGQAGDVRDVLCMRINENWEIGLSCKHNHAAVKHSRLAMNLDFGRKWVQVPCSLEYFTAVNPVFRMLERMRDEGRKCGHRAFWRNLADKENTVYKPILDAFIEEVRRIDNVLDGKLAPRLVHYLLGENDFYKIIANDSERSTRIEAYNLKGTLGQSAKGVKSLYGKSQLKLPSRIIEIRYKDGSINTVELTCDKGWQFSLRIHNASSEIEPSLKFDVQLVSKLSSYASVNIDEPWVGPSAFQGFPAMGIGDETPSSQLSNGNVPAAWLLQAEEVAETLRFREYLPFYSLRAACGKFGDGEVVECDGWVKVEGCGRLDKDMFVVQASGRSMEPKIYDGDLCVMRRYSGGSRQGRILLVQHRETYDPDTGGAYSIKKYSSEKVASCDGMWRHEKITLSPLNSEFKPIELEREYDGEDETPNDRCRTIAEFVKVL